MQSAAGSEGVRGLHHRMVLEDRHRRGRGAGQGVRPQQWPGSEARVDAAPPAWGGLAPSQARVHVAPPTPAQALPCHLCEHCKTPAWPCWLPSRRVRGCMQASGGRREGPCVGTARGLHASWPDAGPPECGVVCRQGWVLPSQATWAGSGQAQVGRGFLQWSWGDGAQGDSCDPDGPGQPWRSGAGR